MKIMVVGGAGYVGQRLCPHLISRGHAVKAVDAMFLGNPIPSYPLIWDDLFNLKVEQLEGYDCVVFLAGLSNDPMANFSPSKNYIQNTAAPAYLAYIAKEAKVPRFIYASSASVYGQCSSPVNENSEARPAYPYGLSKLAGEKAVLQLADSSFQVIALRKGTISGASPRMRFDLAINAMFKDAITKGTVTVNNGNTWRPILAMEDALEAYTRAVESPTITSWVFNICSQNHSMLDVGMQVSAIMRCGLEVRNELEMRDYKLSIAASRLVLDYFPSGSVKGIVSDLKEHYASQPHDWFEQDEHYNIRMLRKQK